MDHRRQARASLASRALLWLLLGPAACAPASDDNPAAGTGGAGGGSGAGGMGGGGGAGAAGGAGGTGATAGAGGSGGSGGTTAITVSNTGPNDNYTVFHPMELAPQGVLNPIVGWGSGGSTDPSWYTLLPHLASHGFVVIGCNTVPTIGNEFPQGEDLIAGIDWMIAENAREDSAFFGKLDTAMIASAGYSMGGLATFTIAGDPRLVTTVHISGGNMETARVSMLHAPAAFLCGENDIADPTCATDFEAATTDVFYGRFMGGDHLGILVSPYAELLNGVTTGWLRWHLMADTTQAALFVGPSCTLCADSAAWTVQQKGAFE
jgi:hypothetical protein